MSRSVLLCGPLILTVDSKDSSEDTKIHSLTRLRDTLQIPPFLFFLLNFGFNYKSVLKSLQQVSGDLRVPNLSDEAIAV